VNVDLKLVAEQFTFREASSGFIISFRAASRKPSIIGAMGKTLAFMAVYAEKHRWPSISPVAIGHIGNTMRR